MQPSIIEKHGFVWMASPRTTVRPLQLLERTHENIFKNIAVNVFGVKPDGEFINATIFSMFPGTTGGEKPEVLPPQPCSIIKGYDILNSKSVISAHLAHLNLPTNGEFSIDIKKHWQLLYSFENVKQLVIDTDILLEEYINSTDPNKKAAGFYEKLKNGQLYVISDVLQATKITIEQASTFDFSGGIDVELLEKYLKAQTSVNHSSDKSQQILFDDSIPAAFAIKAFQIKFVDDTFSLKRARFSEVRGDDDKDDWNGLVTDLMLIKEHDED